MNIDVVCEKKAVISTHLRFFLIVCNHCHFLFNSFIHQLPCGLPPLFPPDVKMDLEQYLLDPAALPIHAFHKTQR